MNKVEILFQEKAVIKNGIMLFTKEDAIDFIKKCKIEKICILGIDSFTIGKEWIQPSMENSIDYSNTTDNQDQYVNAINFIKGKNPQFYFEITCGD